MTPAGINHEMRPWLTMVLPGGDASLDSVEPGRPWGRAWLRLFGVLPIDYDRLTIVELEPGRRFREESTMLSMRVWIHERTLTSDPSDGGTVVIDHVEFEPRWWLTWAGPLLHRLVTAFFAHRHRRLASR